MAVPWPVETAPTWGWIGATGGIPRLQTRLRQIDVWLHANLLLPCKSLTQTGTPQRGPPKGEPQKGEVLQKGGFLRFHVCLQEPELPEEAEEELPTRARRRAKGAKAGTLLSVREAWLCVNGGAAKMGCCPFGSERVPATKKG